MTWGKGKVQKKKLSNNLNSRGKNSNARNLLSQAERGSAAATAMAATNNGGRWVKGAVPFQLNTPNQQVI